MSHNSGDTERRLRGDLARLRILDPFQVLSIARDSSADQVRAAFLTEIKKVHPNRYARESLEARELATELFLLVRRAYTQLADEGKRLMWKERVAPAAPVTPDTRSTPGRGTPAARVPAPQPLAPPPLAPAPQRRPVTSPLLSTADHRRAALESAATRGTRFDKANRLLTEGNHTEARELLHQLTVEEPQNARFRVRHFYARGLEHMAAGRGEDAIRDLERAASVEKDNQEIATALASAKSSHSLGGRRQR